MTKFGAISIAFLLLPTWILAADYNIERHDDGPFSFSISGVEINEGSTLNRESILFNDPTCPIKIQSHKTAVIYADRGFRFSAKTSMNMERKVVAIQIRTIHYDLFGQHMHNLSNTEPKDFNPGQHTITGEWRASDNDISDLLTTVTYVARVRLDDGSQWIFDIDNLQLALSSLSLEQKIGDDEET